MGNGRANVAEALPTIHRASCSTSATAAQTKPNVDIRISDGLEAYAEEMVDTRQKGADDQAGLG